MDYHNHHPPLIDLNKLDETHEIRFDYDNHGNLRRIRKVRRNEGCARALSIIMLLIIGSIVWWIFSS